MTDQPAVLPLAVNDIGVFRINPGLEAIAADGDEPLFTGYARATEGAGGASLRVVVLRAAVDVVKRLRVVESHFVELRHGKILLVVPVASPVVGLVNTSIGADEKMIGVIRVDPQRMVINMLVSDRHAIEIRPAILRQHDERIQGVHAIDVIGIAEDFVVILGAAGHVAAAFLPRLAAIGRAEEAA